MRISDWSSDVCSSDLIRPAGALSSGPDIRRHLIGKIAMPLSIRPINPRRDDFAAEVTGVDVAAGVSKTVAAEIEAAMDRYAVLVLPGQAITDEQQYAFSQHFGPMEPATGDIARTERKSTRLKP